MKKVTDHLYLIPYEGVLEEALLWYSNPEIQWLVNGLKTPYTYLDVEKMYTYQNNHGELYYVMFLENDTPQIIGDIWICEDDFALCLAPDYQGQGIGTALITYFKNYWKSKGYEVLRVSEVYPWNHASNRLFEKCGFTEISKNHVKGYRYYF